MDPLWWLARKKDLGANETVTWKIKVRRARLIKKKKHCWDTSENTKIKSKKGA